MSRDGAIRALVFDIGQVIVRVDAARAVEALARSAGRTAEEILSVIQGTAEMRDFQEGRMTPVEWHAHLTRKVGLPLPFDAFRQVWNGALDREPILGEELFAELAKRHRLVLLSNTDPLHVAHVAATFTFPRYFPARIYSCAVGASKPAEAIYHAAIAAAAVPPGEILYVDDVPAYVEAGRRAGMQTHHFRDAATLVEDLRARKVLR